MFRKRCEGATSSYTILAARQHIALPLPIVLAPPLFTQNALVCQLHLKYDEGWGTLMSFMSAEAGIQPTPSTNWQITREG